MQEDEDPLRDAPVNGVEYCGVDRGGCAWDFVRLIIGAVVGGVAFRFWPTTTNVIAIAIPAIGACYCFWQGWSCWPVLLLILAAINTVIFVCLTYQ